MSDTTTLGNLAMAQLFPGTPEPDVPAAAFAAPDDEAVLAELMADVDPVPDDGGPAADPGDGDAGDADDAPAACTPPNLVGA